MKNASAICFVASSTEVNRIGKVHISNVCQSVAVMNVVKSAWKRTTVAYAWIANRRVKRRDT